MLEAYAAGATVDVEHASGLLGGRPRCCRTRERVIVSLPLALLAARGLAGANRRDARDGSARGEARGRGRRHLPASLRMARLQKAQRAARAADLPDGTGEPARPGALGLVRRRAGRTGRSSGRRRRDRSRSRTCSRSTRSDRPRTIEALFGIVGGSAVALALAASHNALFRARDLPYLYLPAPGLRLRAREPATSSPSTPPFRGFAVTQPWKLAAARTGKPSEDVRAVGAANTLVATRGRWRAENTDVDGVFDPLADHETGEGRSAVVVGSRRRGAGRGRGRAAPRLRGGRRGAARRGGRSGRRGELHVRLDGLGGPGGERGRPLRQRDAGRLAGRGSGRDARDASSRGARSSSTASTGATAGRRRRSGRRAPRAARRSTAFRCSPRRPSGRPSSSESTGVTLEEVTGILRKAGA